MTMRPPTTKIYTVLRTILSAGVLAVLLVLACTGTAAGATWVVDDDGGAGVDYTTIQAAVDAAGEGDMIEVRSGTYVEDTNNVKFRGVVTGEPDFGGAVGSGGVNVQIDEILSDPTGNLTIGDVTTVTWPIAPPFVYINAPIGGRVEVCGEYRDIGEIPIWWSEVGEHWVWLCASDHFCRGLDQPDPPDRSLFELDFSFVYWFQNARVYEVTDWDVINNMSGVPGWDSVIPTSEFNPAGYPRGPMFITTGAESNGLLIREQGHPEVYLIQGGEKHHFTSPEALTWNGYDFDDVIDVTQPILDIFADGDPIYYVGQGAPDLVIKNHFIDAYNRNGGLTVLGSPTTEVHRAWGYLVQDFPGASGYAGGIIMYNPYNNYAYYIHGAIWERYYGLGGPGATTDIEFELGPPISDIEPYIHTLPPEVSSHGTQFRYQHFEGGALNHNVGTGDVLEIHGAIFAKWGELGYADDELGLVTSDEREAAFSPIGTEGRVSDFEGGHIHWHRTGGHGGESYETHGAIDVVYCAEGGSGGDLGFPVSDEYVNPSGYPQGDFEGGYITTTDGVNYEAFEYADKTPPMLVIGIPEDGEEAETYRIDVSGVASDESGIYGVRIKVNGETAAELINSNLGTWNTNVMLFYGKNEIAVTACDNYFNTATETITVHYHPDFTFAHVTDVHIGEDLAEPHLHNIIFELNNYYHEPKLKFALVTGDLVTWNWDWYFNGFLSSMRSLRMDKKYVPGNHDRRSEPTGVLLPQSLENYRKFFPDQTDKIVFEEGGFQFIGLDTGKDYNVSAYWGVPFDPLTLTYDHTPESRGLSQEQIEFLQQEPKNTPKIIFMHHPAIEEIGKNDVRSTDSVSEDPVSSNGPGGNDGCIAFKRSEFIEYCKENNVQFVFTGHTHKDAIVSDDGALNDRIPLSVDSYPFFIQTAAAKDGWYRIVDVKSGITLPRTSRRAESHPNWQGILACPAHLHAYDSQGRHTGLNASGGVETSIPDSFYIGRYNYSDPNETETILLYNTTEEYRFEIVANLTEEEMQSPEIESFNFTVEQQTDDTRTTTAHLSVPLTENTTATLPINLTTTAYTMEIDNDGDGATDETRDPDFTETNYAPTAAIIAPETGSIYNASEPVEFNGTGRDPEDGILTNFSLAWYSDINGVVSAGERFSTKNLSAGAHRITLMVNDSVDLVDTDSVMITVVDLTPPPSITNLTPTADTTYINWTWTNPSDPDFNHTEIYLNGVFQIITSAEHFNATDLTPETSYTISTRTVDTAGNINQTWVNDTATTLTLPAPPTAASSSATGAPKDTYRIDEDVYAAGSGFTTDTNVDIYVVMDQDWNNGDPIPSDVTGSVETVSVANGDVGPVLIWHAPLVIGEYDIVIDANQNGVYDASTDGLDSGSPGFVVIDIPCCPPVPVGPDTTAAVPTISPIGAIILVGLLGIIAMDRIRRRFN